MIISLIAAMGTNRVIGINNQLPWHLPADLKHFKQITMAKPIIMGRKTFESIGKPLPGRLNIIVTHNKGFQAPGCQVVHSLDEALALSKEHDEVMIIGGAQIFAEALPKANKLYLTIIEHDFPGESFFPEWNNQEWKQVSKQNFSADEQNPFSFYFITYERKAGTE